MKQLLYKSLEDFNISSSNFFRQIQVLCQMDQSITSINKLSLILPEEAEEMQTVVFRRLRILLMKVCECVSALVNYF